MDADQDNSNACTTTSVESRDDGVLSPSNAEDNTLSASLNVDQDSNASAAAAANSVVDDVGSPSDNANIQDDQGNIYCQLYKFWIPTSHEIQCNQS